MNDEEIRILQKRNSSMKIIEYHALEMINEDVPSDMVEMIDALRTLIRLSHAERVRICEILGDDLMRDTRRRGDDID